MRIVGVDIGGTKCTVTASDAAADAAAGQDGLPGPSLVIPTTTRDATIEQLLGAVAQLAPGPEPVFGIACGSPQDAARGVILEPPNLPGWVDVPIVELLTARFGGRGWLMNDANAGALAEWCWGAARGARHAAFLTCGTGLGAGLILNGALYEGAGGNAGEIGHLRLADDGPIGFGKAGSAEGFCSGGGIARLARRMADASPDPPGWMSARPTTRDIARAADAGDPFAIAILSESGRRLGQALAILIDLLNLERIVLGTVYARCRRWLEPPMREVLAREALPDSLARCQILEARLSPDELPRHQALAVALYRLGRLTPPAPAILRNQS